MSTGKWVTEHIHQAENGKLYFAHSYLLKYKGIVHPTTWYRYVDSPCPDLPLSVNDGKIRFLKLQSPYSHQDVILFHQDDVDLIVKRRWCEYENESHWRQWDPAETGKWITERIFQLSRDIQSPPLKTGDLLMTDNALAADGKVSDMVLVRCRRESHPALDPAVNKGRLRWLRVSKLHRSKGPGTVIVSSHQDWERITEWRRQLRDAKIQAPGETARRLAERLGLDTSPKQFDMA